MYLYTYTCKGMYTLCMYRYVHSTLVHTVAATVALQVTTGSVLVCARGCGGVVRTNAEREDQHATPQSHSTQHTWQAGRWADD